ncbi:GYD domain-containing protein [Paraburkholderia silviterrae]|uniref:GYD domain-containing protein n=1 Tax=Paraburkholderia silviterrae TaxID=2528715 RepID=A0A4R5LX99_9BURK|nr:GYD domain-containing protein [Paraburkholderia silviterrae]TDG16607.1 GYD domain-containing protein [Paraburkholderia silviterrae]
MATYISLWNFTDQGIRAVKDTTKRAGIMKEMAQKAGVTVKDIFWTLGAYDGVVIFEAADEEAIAAVGLALGAMGNVRTQSLRAFSLDEMKGVLGKLP